MDQIVVYMDEYFTVSTKVWIFVSLLSGMVVFITYTKWLAIFEAQAK